MIPQKTMFKISHNNQKETSYAFWLDIIPAKCGVCFIICRICPQKKNHQLRPVISWFIPLSIFLSHSKSPFWMVKWLENPIFPWFPHGKSPFSDGKTKPKTKLPASSRRGELGRRAFMALRNSCAKTYEKRGDLPSVSLTWENHGKTIGKP